MKTQIRNLFDGFVGTNIKLGFWTFSHQEDPSREYNVYSHDYEKPGDVSGQLRFENALNEIDLAGQTNYEQALSYNNGIPNSNPTIKKLRDGSSTNHGADVISIVTDGAPNYPGNQDPVNESSLPNDAETSAHNAVLKLKQDNPNVTIVGNVITGVSQKSMNYTVNGDKNDSTNVGPFDFSSMEDFLKDRITAACNSTPQPDYSLVPIVQKNDDVISSGVVPTFNYSVRNDSTDDVDGASSWQIYDVLLKPNVAGNPLNCGSTSYCNNIASCADIYALIGGSSNGDCKPSKDENDTGNNKSNDTFPHSPDLKTLYTNRAAQVDNIDGQQLGTRICRVLQLSKPAARGVTNRISSDCVTIGKTPLAQIHGGDLRVGRSFDDAGKDANAGVFTSRFSLSGSAAPGGRTFGSWVEYGIFAPGKVNLTASLSGYNGPYGGFDGLDKTKSCDATTISRLTFANTIIGTSPTEQGYIGECGHLSSDTLGSIPNVISPLTSLSEVTGYAQPLKIDPSSPKGLYKNTSTNASFEIGKGTIPKGTSGQKNVYVVYVPNGTATISDDIVYDDATTYQSLGEISQMVIIAKNIKIKDNVGRIDAWLIANGSADGEGVINTCVNASGSTPALSANVCQKDLRINGPVIARQLLLWRTKVDTSPSACKIDQIDSCQNVGDPAETMTLPGATLLWTQAFGASTSRAQTTYTVEMPPFY